ncbi:MAG: GreA/GreB family elongation factor [Polyangiaceae bacterium]
MPRQPDKAALREELARSMAADLALRERAYEGARAGATDEEAKPENDKDTRALEQSYLARGEAVRVEELRTALAEVRGFLVRAFGAEDPVALGALVTTEDDDGSTTVLWLAPHGGGAKLSGGAVQVVTPKSPLGRAIVGARAGDACEVAVGGKKRKTLTLVEVK